MPYSHSSVDEQVVKMAFDNSNFDQNINDSIKALNNLDNRLGTLNKQDFSGITNSLDKLANVFTVKGQIMFGVFARLGNEIVNVTKKGINKLTAGIKDGLNEYNQIIDATQTIYQNVKQSGASINDVNYALDELNDYADKTVYNFGQMTRMIGQFSSAGVSLNKSVSTIKGLANAAALVGANMEKAQIAWNAVSRAMSSGKFTNTVWRSLELSGIAGKQFNTVITEVAKANNVVGKSGKNIDEMIKKYGSLRETLREGWLTKDLFNEAMEIMSGGLSEADLQKKGYTDKQIKELLAIADAAEEAATKVKTFKQLMETTGEAIGSGWAQSFRILIGDLEQAKILYTRISEVVNSFIDNNANIRNKLFKQIVDDIGIDGIWESGREKFKKIIENMLASVKTFIKSVQTGFLNIFPIERISSAARKVLDTVEKFTRALVINNEEVNRKGKVGWDTDNINKVSDAVKDLIRFFRGLASVIDVAWMSISQPLKVIIKRIPFLQNFFDNTHDGIIGLVKNLGTFGDKLTVFRNAVKNTEVFGQLLEIILDNIDEIGERFPVLGFFLSIFKNLKLMVSGIKEGFKSMEIKPLSALFGALKLIATAFWNVLNLIFQVLNNIKNNIDWSFLNAPKNLIEKVIKKLSDYGQGLISFEEITGNIGKSIKEITSKIVLSINKIFGNKKIKTGVGEITKTYSNFNITLSNTGKKISDIWDKIKSFFMPIKDFFVQVFAGADWTLDGIAKKIGLIGAGVGAASLSISHLIKTFYKIKILDSINDILSAGLDVIKAYQREMQSKMILNIAIAIGILATSLTVLSLIPYENLENGLVIFSSFMAVLAMTLPPIITAMAKFNRSIKYTRAEIRELTKYDVLNSTINNFINQLGNFGQAMASALNKKMIGEMCKDVAFSLFILVGAIAALVLLIKLDGDAVKKALHTFGVLIVTLTLAVGGLILAVNLFSKTAKNTKASIGTFASFFKLSGVAGVIIAIAGAVTVLVGALAVMTMLNQDKLHSCWILLLSIIGMLGLISMYIATVTARAKDLGKFKKISVSLGGAMVGIAVVILAMKPLIETIKNDASDSWIKAIAIFTAVITQFTGMVTALLFVAKKIGGQTKVWDHLNKFMLITSATIASMAGVVYAISLLGEIPTSTVVTIGILATAMLGVISLLSLIAIVISRAKTTFSTNFATVINKISIGIAAVVSSIGIMTAGIAALIASLSSFDITDSDTNKASNNLVSKLKVIANALYDALPELKKIFYNIGKYVGTMFTALITGFITNIIETGEMYDEVAEKFINLIIDMLDKVVNIIHNRKEDIARIIRKLIESIGTIVTDTVNAFFSKGGKPAVTEEQVLNFLGFTGITIGGGAALLKIASNFNTISNSIKNVQTLYGSLTKMAQANGVTTFQLLAQYASAILAIVAAIEAVKLAYHGLRQLSGEEARYIRSDVKSIEDAWNAFFTDSQYRYQKTLDTVMKIGEFIVTIGVTVKKVIGAIAGFILQTMYWPIYVVGTAIADTMDTVFGNKSGAEKMRKTLFGIGKTFEYMTLEWQTIGEDWKRFANMDYDSMAQNVYDGAKDVYENLKEGSLEGLEDYRDEVGKKAKEDTEYIVGDVIPEAAGTHSPSTITRDVYHNVMLGCIEGLNLGAPELEKRTKELIERENQLFKDGAIDASQLWSDMLSIGGVSDKNVIRDFRATVVDYRKRNESGSYTAQEIYMNKEIVDLIESQAEALEGKNREEARNYLLNQMRLAGMKSDAEAIEEMQLTLEAFYTNAEDHTRLHADSIKDFAKSTITSVLDVAGKSAAATETLIQDTYGKYFDLLTIAENHKEELIGKKKEEVQEILKQEAIKAGLTQQEAEDTSRMLAGQLFAGLEAEKTITKEHLDVQLKANETEYFNYERLQREKTKLLEEECKTRNEIAKTQAWIQSKFDAGWTDSEYRSWYTGTDEGRKYQKLLSQSNAATSRYKNIIKQQEDSIKKLYTDAGMSSENAAKKWSSDYDRALNLINSAASKKSGTFVDKIKNVFGNVAKSLGLSAGDVNLDYWNLGKDDGGNGGLNDKDKNNAVQAASDLKNSLEKERADLTPTFDLDKLASDANKANGIVMSSLMAAQNASIGDYINKDSELNPFMKDRWQNVYNFTQNNYSPKALSRIDIYRQTQRQISMSRGF